MGGAPRPGQRRSGSIAQGLGLGAGPGRAAPREHEDRGHRPARRRGASRAPGRPPGTKIDPARSAPGRCWIRLRCRGPRAVPWHRLEAGRPPGGRRPGRPGSCGARRAPLTRRGGIRAERLERRASESKAPALPRNPAPARRLRSVRPRAPRALRPSALHSPDSRSQRRASPRLASRGAGPSQERSAAACRAAARGRAARSKRPEWFGPAPGPACGLSRTGGPGVQCCSGPVIASDPTIPRCRCATTSNSSAPTAAKAAI